jgi:hypothetical protein
VTAIVALTARSADRTGARLRLPAGPSTTVGARAALVASLIHDLLLVLDGQKLGLSKAQRRTGNGVRRGHGRPERTAETEWEMTNLEDVADEVRQVPVTSQRHIADLRADRVSEGRQERCNNHQTANELRDMAVVMSLGIVAWAWLLGASLATAEPQSDEALAISLPQTCPPERGRRQALAAARALVLGVRAWAVRREWRPAVRTREVDGQAMAVEEARGWRQSKRLEARRGWGTRSGDDGWDGRGGLFHRLQQ